MRTSYSLLKGGVDAQAIFRTVIFFLWCGALNVLQTQYHEKYTDSAELKRYIILGPEPD